MREGPPCVNRGALSSEMTVDEGGELRGDDALLTEPLLLALGCNKVDSDIAKYPLACAEPCIAPCTAPCTVRCTLPCAVACAMACAVRAVPLPVLVESESDSDIVEIDAQRVAAGSEDEVSDMEEREVGAVHA